MVCQGIDGSFTLISAYGPDLNWDGVRVKTSQHFTSETTANAITPSTRQGDFFGRAGEKLMMMGFICTPKLSLKSLGKKNAIPDFFQQKMETMHRK